MLASDPQDYLHRIAPPYQPCRLLPELNVGPRNRELYTLIQPDRTIKHRSLSGIGGRSVNKKASVANALARNEHALAFMPSRMYQRPSPSSQ